MKNILPNLQGVLWSKNVSNLDLQQDKNYIIHQVLMYGSLDHIKWLRSVYSNAEIKEVFIEKPKKIYTPQAFNLIKNYLLKIKINLSEKNYVKTVY